MTLNFTYNRRIEKNTQVTFLSMPIETSTLQILLQKNILTFFRMKCHTNLHCPRRNPLLFHHLGHCPFSADEQHFGLERTPNRAIKQVRSRFQSKLRKDIQSKNKSEARYRMPTETPCQQQNPVHFYHLLIHHNNTRTTQWKDVPFFDLRWRIMLTPLFSGSQCKT